MIPAISEILFARRLMLNHDRRPILVYCAGKDERKRMSYEISRSDENAIKELEHLNEMLVAENELLKKEKARMDWLSKQDRVSVDVLIGDGMSATEYIGGTTENQSMREAIDDGLAIESFGIAEGKA